MDSGDGLAVGRGGRSCQGRNYRTAIRAGLKHAVTVRAVVARRMARGPRFATRRGVFSAGRMDSCCCSVFVRRYARHYSSSVGVAVSFRVARMSRYARGRSGQNGGVGAAGVTDGGGTASPFSRTAIGITGRGGRGCRGRLLRRSADAGSYRARGGRFLRKVAMRFPVAFASSSMRSSGCWRS